MLIEGIGDDVIFVVGFLFFGCIILLAWLSTDVSHIHFPTTLFIIERRSRRRNSQHITTEPASNIQQQTEEQRQERDTNDHNTLMRETITQALNYELEDHHFPSGSETQTEVDSDLESSENEESFLSDQLLTNTTQSSFVVCNDSNQLSQDRSAIECNDQSKRSQTNDINSSNNDRTTNNGITPVVDENSLHILIKFLNDTQKAIVASPNDTISTVKRMYFSDELANNKSVRFIYQGRVLDDKYTLQSYNIKDQTTIHCQISQIRQPPSIAQEQQNNSQTSFDHSFIDSSPIDTSSFFILLIGLLLGFVWFLRVRCRQLFTPISTLMLIIITLMYLIFTFGTYVSPRLRQTTRTISVTSTSSQIQHMDEKLRQDIYRILSSLSCPYIKLSIKIFDNVQNNIRIFLWLLDRYDKQLYEKLSSTRITDIQLIKEFCAQACLFPFELLNYFDKIWSITSQTTTTTTDDNPNENYHIGELLFRYMNTYNYHYLKVHSLKPTITMIDIQLGLIEYVVDINNCSNLINSDDGNKIIKFYQNMWEQREKLEMFENFAIDEQQHIKTNAKIIEYLDDITQDIDHQFSNDLNEALKTIKDELILIKQNNADKQQQMPPQTILTTEQQQNYAKQLDLSMNDWNEFYKKFKSIIPTTSSTTTNHSTTCPLIEINKHNIDSILKINRLNDINSRTDKNNQLFLNKCQEIFSNLSTNNENLDENKQLLSLDAQVELTTSLNKILTKIKYSR
ncbi:unnamed protein product [Didymodactylos carnosus]|uniref:Ubiquitin-like domain-containing protein n=1 Tax=Didymodactylos carnosus TaxID=1234261 RepID=A0A813UAU6_9BILA|nr:unnamed protein product [Didymodactylos carnosus]CAF0938158.1 unnamed protein product [Didymodactylos carnosus]CAF3609916.1 unnamed protein product [Didymodactylos carnosus]CAF3713629.1 unnamed protein product [Didymodactylos carnosus]